ncbi:MAG: AAA family ATPase, partial [Bacteroidota bacterium]
QVLDDGRLTDNKGRVANFKNTIIIMTTNLGSHLIHENLASLEEKNIAATIEKTKNEVLELLRKTMRPEFLNRIDEIIMFRPLSQTIIKQVVAIQLQQVQEQLKQNGIALSILDKQVVDYLSREGYNPQFGARPLKRLIQRSILNGLSKELLIGKIRKDMPIQAALTGSCEIQFFNATKGES